MMTKMLCALNTNFPFLVTQFIVTCLYAHKDFHFHPLTMRIHVVVCHFRKPHACFVHQSFVRLPSYFMLLFRVPCSHSRFIFIYYYVVLLYGTHTTFISTQFFTFPFIFCFVLFCLKSYGFFPKPQYISASLCFVLLSTFLLSLCLCVCFFPIDFK